MNLGVTIAAVALMGGAGALIRYLLAFWQGALPWGILLANSIGSLIAGVGVQTGNIWLVAGLAGGLSTFSTFAAQGYELWSKGKKWHSISYLLLNLVLPAAAFLTGAILL